MERRTFIQCLSGGMLLAAGLPLQARGRRPLRFGVVTDLHYAERETVGSRFYSHSLQKLRAAVEVFNRSSLDFVIELGDLKDSRPDKDAVAALRFLDDVESELQQFHGKVYHVLGNHDMDCLSKEEFCSTQQTRAGLVAGVTTRSRPTACSSLCWAS